MIPVILVMGLLNETFEFRSEPLTLIPNGYFCSKDPNEMEDP